MSAQRPAEPALAHSQGASGCVPALHRPGCVQPNDGGPLRTEKPAVSPVAGMVVRTRSGSTPSDSRVQRLVSWLMAEWHRERQERRRASSLVVSSGPKGTPRLDFPDHRAPSFQVKGAHNEEH